MHIWIGVSEIGKLRVRANGGGEGEGEEATGVTGSSSGNLEERI